MLLPWIKVDSFIPIILPNLNPICHLLALGAHYILHVGRIRVNIHNNGTTNVCNTGDCISARVLTAIPKKEYNSGAG
jgi:hypothetical protein